MLARSTVPPLVLATLIAVAYGASTRNDFVHDDTLFMTDARVQSLGEMPRLLREPRWGFETDSGAARIHQYYRPLEPLPYVAAHFDAARPRTAHLVSLFLHLLNSLLVLALLRRWLGDATLGLFGAALFAVYPAFSEAVLWPAAAGGLGAFSCTWAIFLLNVGTPARWWAGALSALLFTAALFFKETGVLAPAYVILGWLLLAPPRARSGLLAALTFVVPFVLYALLRAAALGRVTPRLDYLPFTWFEIGLNGLALVPTYATALAWPFDLCFHHDFSAVDSAAEPRVWLGTALLALGLAGAWTMRRRAATFSFGLCALFAAAAPYLILHKPGDNVFAERYLYDLAPGALLACGAIVRALTRQRHPAWRVGMAALGVAALALFVAVDRQRSGEWRDEVTLFRRTLQQAPRAEIIRVNLGVRLLRLGRIDEGIAVLEELQRLAPDYRGGRENLALLYHAAGRLDDAVAALEGALAQRPDVAKSLLNLAYFYDEQGRRFDAATTYFRLIGIEPGYVDAWNNLAIIAREEGQPRNARHAARRVLAGNPKDRGALALLRRLDDQAAPPLQPANPETQQRCATARALADAGRYRLAAAQLRAAAWLDEASPLPHQFLANVYVLSGKPRAALRHQREALRLAPGNSLYRRNLRALRRQLAQRKPPPAGPDP